MDNPVTLVLMAACAVGLGIYAFVKPGTEFRDGIRFAFTQLRDIAYLLVTALMLTALLSTLVPEEMVARFLGEEAGIRGILLASAIGGFVPGGPSIAFPLILALSKMGVATSSLVAFLSAWSVYALHRVLMFEIPLLGWRFAVLRLGASSFVPVATGVIAGLMVDLLRGGM